MPILSQIPHGLTELQGTSSGARKGWATRRSFGSLKQGLRANAGLYHKFKTEQSLKRYSRQEAENYQGAAETAESRGMRGLAKRLKQTAQKATRQMRRSRRSAQSVVRRITSGK